MSLAYSWYIVQIKTSRGSRLVPHFIKQMYKKILRRFSKLTDKLAPATSLGWADGFGKVETRTSGRRQRRCRKHVHKIFTWMLVIFLYLLCPTVLSPFAECPVRWVAATWNWTAAANKGQQRVLPPLSGACVVPASPPPLLTTWPLTLVRTAPTPTAFWPGLFK